MARRRAAAARALYSVQLSTQVTGHSSSPAVTVEGAHYHRFNNSSRASMEQHNSQPLRGRAIDRTDAVAGLFSSRGAVPQYTRVLAGRRFMFVAAQLAVRLRVLTRCAHTTPPRPPQRPLPRVSGPLIESASKACMHVCRRQTVSIRSAVPAAIRGCCVLHDGYSPSLCTAERRSDCVSEDVGGRASELRVKT